MLLLCRIGYATVLLLSAVFYLPVAAGINGPVISSDFPDPSILEVNGTKYAFSTNSGGKNIQVAISSGATWTLTNIDALPVLGKWGKPGKTWAPDVIQRKDGLFVMYYTANNISPNTQCVGTATSKTPTGPYTPQETPFACPASEGGAIDPAGFIDDDGTYWAVYKVDGNSLGGGGPCGNGDGSHSTPIRLQKFGNDAITPVGEPLTILDRGVADGPLIEAPSLIKRGSLYIVFFSSNCFNTPLYDISYATAPSITGSYAKAQAPLLVTGQFNLTAPGGADAVPGGDMIVFHANVPAGRGMFQASLTWNGNVATVE